MFLWNRPVEVKYWRQPEGASNKKINIYLCKVFNILLSYIM